MKQESSMATEIPADAAFYEKERLEGDASCAVSPEDTAREEGAIVDWSGPEDRQNPRNWPTSLKCWVTLVTTAMTFVVSFGGSIFSATADTIAIEFGCADEFVNIASAIYVLGYGCGPLIWGPWSEAGYGRRGPLILGCAGFLLSEIALATAANVPTIIVSRLLSGAFGSCTLAIVPGMHVDLWQNPARAFAVVSYSAAVLAGPTLGPVLGILIMENARLGWRWTSWLTIIVAAALSLLALVSVPETHAAALLQRKARAMRRETGNWNLHTRSDEDIHGGESLLVQYALKPFKMIVQEPILLALTLYTSIAYGILYLICFAFPVSLRTERNMDAQQASLPFLATFFGMLVACTSMVWTYGRTFAAGHSKAPVDPEAQLPPMMAGSVILVVGLICFALTSSLVITVWFEILSCVFIGLGFALVLVPVFMYLVDFYLFHANSALAINAMVRSCVAASLPIFADPMYTSLGTQDATLLLAGICALLGPSSFFLYRYGGTVRKWGRFVVNVQSNKRMADKGRL